MLICSFSRNITKDINNWKTYKRRKKTKKKISSKINISFLSYLLSFYNFNKNILQNYEQFLQYLLHNKYKFYTKYYLFQ